MADSVRMLDSAALTRGLDEFRRIDPEQRSLGQRLAAEAAAHELEEIRRDVPENEKSSASQARNRGDGREHRKDRQRSASEDQAEAQQGDSRPPEIDEGRVLDIKV